MAPTFVSTALHVIVLAAVVIPGLADFYISDTSRSAIRSPRQIQRATFPDGYVAHPDIGLAYKTYNKGVTWSEARRGCISEGAHLAEIDTLLKLAYVMNVDSGPRWTGIHRMQDDSEWLSSRTGLNMTTLPWGGGEAHSYRNQDCAYASIEDLGLSTARCSYRISYACELPINSESSNAQGLNETVVTGAE